MSVPDFSITTAQRYIDFLLSRERGLELPVIPRHCVISYVPDVIDQMKTLHSHRSLTLGVTNPMQLHFFTPEQGAPFAIARGMHGAPMAAVQLEELIALGCEEFLVIGPAGHPTEKPQPDMQLGDLLLATHALIFEGTSPHYGSLQHSSPATGSIERLRVTLQDLGLLFRQGTVATTDALYRETGAFIKELLERQVLAIEMELSALCTVAHCSGKNLAGLVFISDLVRTDGSWDIAPSPKIYCNVVNQLTNVVHGYVEQQ
ncbi:MAG: hypothetical protein MI684_00020 [Chlorobiales bacterium]|nr:hypothetical protein [Chlorobiales bacterium]